MDPTLKTILLMMTGAAITGLIGGPIAFLWTRLNKRSDRKTDKVLAEEAEAIEEVKKQKALVEELRVKMAVLEAEAKPINAAYLAMLVAKATHFHTPVMDALLAKLGPPSTLTPEELSSLEILIQERMLDMGPEIDEAERIGVTMIISASKLADLEHASLGTPPMETVLISQPATETTPSPNNGSQEEETK